jgi:hypothetical protein
MTDNQTFKAPTQPLDLPSKGLVYPDTHPLSSGIVELYMPTAFHEDILTNRNYIQQGLVIDKFLQAIIATKMNYDDLLIGDKNAIIVASRILAYGSNYAFKYTDSQTKEQEVVTVDLADLKNKELNWDLFKKGKNEFEYELPLSKKHVTFKLLSHKDEALIESEVKALQKVNKNISADVTVKLSNTILSVDGNRDTKTIREFVKAMPMRDSQELKKYMASITPDIDMKFDFVRSNGEVVEGLSIPMTVDFFWPNLGI